MAIDAKGNPYDPVALIDPATGLPASGGGGGGGAANPYPGVDYATNARQDTGNTALTAIRTATGVQADAATVAGADTGIIGALRAIRDRLLGNTSATALNVQGTASGTPVRVDVVSTVGGGGGGGGATDAVQTVATITATGAQTGVSTAGYGSILLELTGTFNASVSLQGSSDSTNGIDGTWTNLLGSSVDDIASGAPNSTLTTSQRRREYRAPDAAWVRVNTTSYTSGTIVATLARRTAPIGERAVYVGGGTVNVIGLPTATAATSPGSQFFVESPTGTAIAASGAVTGATHDFGASLTTVYTRVTAKASVSAGGGTLVLVESNDNFVTSFNTATATITAGPVAVITQVPVCRYWRFVITKDTTAGNVGIFNSAQTVN